MAVRGQRQNLQAWHPEIHVVDEKGAKASHFEHIIEIGFVLICTDKILTYYRRLW
jgi:hypothetical protein